MAVDKKISELTELAAAPAADDMLLIVDTSEGDNKKISASNLGGGAWTAWTPTLSGLFANAKWNKTGYYTLIGKTVHFKLRLVANTTTPMSGAGNAVITLPLTAASFTSGDQNMNIIGTVGVLDSGTALYPATISVESTTTARVRSTISAAFTSTVPMTWTTNDEIYLQGTYEAA